MGTSASELVKQAIAAGLADEARRADFRRSGNRWSRVTAPGTVQALSVQGSQSNTTGNAKFTMNLGVYFAQLAEELERDVVAAPKEIDCQIRTRLGPVVHGEARWWAVESEEGAKRAGDEMARQWVTVGLPWLERVSDPSGALAWLRSEDFAFHGPVIGAALALLLNQREAARDIVARYRDRIPPPWMPWAIDRGLV